MALRNADEEILATRVRNGNFEIHCPGSMVHRIPIQSSTKEVWEPNTRETGPSSGRLPGETNEVVDVPDENAESGNEGKTNPDEGTMTPDERRAKKEARRAERNK
jgi:hypothetical protein